MEIILVKKFMKKKWSILGVSLLAGVILAACQQQEEGSTDSEDATETVTDNQEETEEITFTDSMDREVVLDGHPENIVVLAPEFLKMLYDLDGEAVGRMETSSIPLPEAAEDIPELGTVNQINTEELLGLSPDLVIGAPNFHADLEEVMDSSDVPFALLQMRSFDDVQEMATLMGEIIGQEELASERIAETEMQMQAVEEQIPADESPSVVVLNVTPGSLSIQRANTTAIEIGHLIHVNNIGENMEASEDSQTSAPFSLETIAEQQPDHILVTIHGSHEAGMESMEENLETNPAWSGLNAVQEGNVHVLPSEMYLSNPGFDYAATMEHMAEMVYPGVLGDE